MVSYPLTVGKVFHFARGSDERLRTMPLQRTLEYLPYFYHIESYNIHTLVSGKVEVDSKYLCRRVNDGSK